MILRLKIEEWDDRKFVLDLRKSLKDKTPLSFTEKDLKKEIIRHTGFDVDDTEKCFQKMMGKGLAYCSTEISILDSGILYNITEYGNIRGYFDPQDMEEKKDCL